jgi:hypothetical protein
MNVLRTWALIVLIYGTKAPLYDQGPLLLVTACYCCSMLRDVGAQGPWRALMEPGDGTL